MNRHVWETSSSSSDDEDVRRRQKVYKKRINYCDTLDELEFYQRFRITKDTFEILYEQTHNNLQRMTQRGGAIQPRIQLLLTLRYYALGSMQKAVSDFMGVSVSSACRIIKTVSETIAALRPLYIKMPNSMEEMQNIAVDFYSIARFPRVIGAIDCTLIKIDSPGGEDAEIFRCRKQWFALNVQTISDAKLRILDIVARWPGSTHDQTIFNNSNIKRRFENHEFGDFVLLGDSGYQLTPYLMTKLYRVENEAENLYNESLIRTRNVVERQYGVWKRRFPILKNSMALKLETTMAVIVATAVIHNMAIEETNLFDEDSGAIQDNNGEENEHEDEPEALHQTAQIVRNNIVEEHFGRM